MNAGARKGSPHVPDGRSLWLALGVSLLLHVVVLSLHFTFPDAARAFQDRALDIIPVSYTHLDVYKRQDWNSPMAQATRDAAATLSRRLGYGTVDDGVADRQSAEHAGQPGTADGACA